MPALVAGIHVFLLNQAGRGWPDKSGHDAAFSVKKSALL
jgi:hypothetical protein